MPFPAKHWARLSTEKVSLIGSMPWKILLKPKMKLKDFINMNTRDVKEKMIKVFLTFLYR